MRNWRVLLVTIVVMFLAHPSQAQSGPDDSSDTSYGIDFLQVNNPNLFMGMKTNGTAGSILLLDSNGNLGQDNANFQWDPNHRLWVNITPNPTHWPQTSSLNIYRPSSGGSPTYTAVADGSAGPAQLAVKYGNSGGAARFLFYSVGGSLAIPSATQSGYILGQVEVGGYGTALTGVTGLLQFTATENWSGTATGTNFLIQRVPATTTTIQQIMLMNDDQKGSVYFNPSGDMGSALGGRADIFNMVGPGNSTGTNQTNIAISAMPGVGPTTGNFFDNSSSYFNPNIFLGIIDSSFNSTTSYSIGSEGCWTFAGGYCNVGAGHGFYVFDNKDNTTVLTAGYNTEHNVEIGSSTTSYDLLLTGNIISLGNSGSGPSITSAADGLLNVLNNAGTHGPQINTGTASPTVTSCGTGSVTSHSTNTAGEVTATGATTCTLSFGAPNFTNQPFCTATEETSANAVRISAISTSSFTITGLTSGDKFMYHCFGGT